MNRLGTEKRYTGGCRMKIRQIFAVRRLQLKCRLFLEVYAMTAYEVAKYFVSLVDEDAGDSISNLKVQKLLYYAQGFHLAVYEKPLFPEAVKAWAHGPVVPQVYHEYKQYGAGSIPVERVDLEAYSPEVRELLDEVWAVYGQFTASKLEGMTHQEPPWMDTPQSEAISHASMTTFFKTLVIEDEDGQGQDTQAQAG
jgi:uncharacterized phage-associated protein